MDMEIKFVDEAGSREVELVGKVICTRSYYKYNTFEKFQEGSEYNLYKQVFKDNSTIYIVFNDDGGWYLSYLDIDDLCGNYFTFKIK